MGFGLYMDIKMYHIKKYFILSLMLYMQSVPSYARFLPSKYDCITYINILPAKWEWQHSPIVKTNTEYYKWVKTRQQACSFFLFPIHTRGRKKAFSSSLFTFILATLLLYIVTAASIANEAKSESIVREGLKPLLFGKRTNTVICIMNGIIP